MFMGVDLSKLRQLNMELDSMCVECENDKLNCEMKEVIIRCDCCNKLIKQGDVNYKVDRRGGSKGLIRVNFCEKCFGLKKMLKCFNK